MFFLAKSALLSCLVASQALVVVQGAATSIGSSLKRTAAVASNKKSSAYVCPVGYISCLDSQLRLSLTTYQYFILHLQYLELAAGRILCAALFVGSLVAASLLNKGE
jgi:hypothetical protein